MKNKINRKAMEEAVAAFLEAAGITTDNPTIMKTPRKVAEAWADELLAGYSADIPAILKNICPADNSGPVIMTGISYVGVCPDHLIPYRGKAHIAYIPEKNVAGFGSMVRLVEALGARLVLQEDLARDIAEALTMHLGATGAGCIIEAYQGCIGLRGVKQPHVMTTTSFWTGILKESRSPERLSIESSLHFAATGKKTIPQDPHC